MSTNGPLPTTLIFLNDLPSLRLQAGSKVRFLGCVAKYSVKTGVLALEHAYSPPLPPSPLNPHPERLVAVVALVDVSLLLAGLTVTDTQVGEWVNVVGYVTAGGDSSSRTRDEEGGKEVDGRRRVFVNVQAIMLWSAGSVRIGEYERVLAERQRLDKELRNCNRY